MAGTLAVDNGCYTIVRNESTIIKVYHERAQLVINGYSFT